MPRAQLAKTVRFSEIGGPLKIETISVPEPDESEVRVRVKALGLNRVEALFRAGEYFLQPTLPSKIGVEGSGIVDAVGEGVDPKWQRKRVSIIPSLDMTIYGIAGEVAIVPASSLLELPSSLTFEQGAAVWMTYLTAYGALIQQQLLTKGDFLLLNAASSSVGLAAMKLAKAQGAVSIATTRSKIKKDLLLQMGADEVIVVPDEDVAARVKEITRGAGAKVVIDSVAGKGLATLAQATATGGTIVLCGFLGTDMFGVADGMPTPFPFIDAVGRNLNIRGYNAGFLMRHPVALAEAVKYIEGGLASGALTVQIDKTFPLDEIEEAYRYQGQNGQVGKIVVSV